MLVCRHTMLATIRRGRGVHTRRVEKTVAQWPLEESQSSQRKIAYREGALEERTRGPRK